MGEIKKMNHVLVTGGAGFIGAYLVKRLIEMKVRVTIVDNLQDVGGISYIHPEANFINSNICDISLYPQLEKLNIDTVYHLAAQSAGEPSYDDPKFDILTNSYGTYLVAKFCKDNNVSRLIYTSTVAVYGDNIKGILDENSKINPDSIYGVSKYSGELFIQQMLKNSQTKYTIFRVFNTYGPGENLNFQKKGMISIYISFLWKKQFIHVKGSLDRYRDFTFIDDNIDALISCHEKSISYGEVYNLSSGKKTLVKDLIKSILISFNLPLDYKVVELPGTPGDSFGFHSNPDKIKSHLDWDPNIDLTDGLKEYHKWVNIVPVVDRLDNYHPFALERM
jgi:UDP-glucose 4-epimerase